MEMYVEDSEQYQGMQEMMTKLGLRIQDSLKFVVARRTFTKYVPVNVMARPKEGDLIYLPLHQKLFEIKFVEDEAHFFQFGNSPFLYELKAELFQYSEERISTGVDMIDIISDEVGRSIELFLTAGVGNFHVGETIFQGTDLGTATFSGRVKDWNPSALKLEVVFAKGTPSLANVKGYSSGMDYSTATANTMVDAATYQATDSYQFETQANTFMVRTENNPFGTP